tara:strand:- start:5512 stop:6258 length:747 start_codon:yes stop_codon:yes gene_type:complete
MTFYITYEGVHLKNKAQDLSKRLDAQIIIESKLTKKNDYAEDYFLVLTSDRKYISKGLRKNSKPIFSDFDKWSVNYEDRLLQKSIRGLPQKFTCLDLTAGFGKDSLEISKIKNCDSIALIEKELWVYELLKDGLKNATSLKALDLLSKFRIYNLDNFEFIRSSEESFDLIYIDPMFSGVQKSKAKKHMQALRDLSSSVNSPGLLKTSLEKAKHRVIVKRHKNMGYLESLEPTRSVEGKVVRYDVYNIK